MDDLLIRGVVIPSAEIQVRFSRSGGPGGQNVNKRSTRVEMVFDLADSAAITGSRKALAMKRLASKLDSAGRLRVVAEDERTQSANRASAVEKLTGLLDAALKPPPKKRAPTKPSRGATERRLAEKKARGAIKRLRSAPPDD